MDQETLKAIKEIFKEEFEKGLEPVKSDIKILKEGQNRLEKKIDKLEEEEKEIKSSMEYLDPKNADRHLELRESIEELRKGLLNVEVITSSNWNAIAKFKRERINEEPKQILESREAVQKNIEILEILKAMQNDIEETKVDLRLVKIVAANNKIK